VVVVGEALVDVVRSHAGRRDAYPGGSAANVAVALARQEVSTALFTRLGSDEFGELITRHLADNQVSLLNAPDEAPTDVAEATIDADGKAEYAFQMRWELTDEDADRIDTTTLRCVHTGSIGATLSPGAATVARLVTNLRPRATISYDPNCRPTLMGQPDSVRHLVERLVGLADVVKASDEDLAWLYPDRHPLDTARSWQRSGPGLVVVTLGSAGYKVFTRHGTMAGPAPAVSVVDTVGAGDTFTAALLAGLHQHRLLGADHREALHAIPIRTLTSILHTAAVAASITCSRPGADPPTARELARAVGVSADEGEQRAIRAEGGSGARRTQKT
jgi:fructokinase